MFKPLHGTFRSPNAVHREQVSKAQAALGGAKVDTSSPAPSAPAPSAPRTPPSSLRGAGAFGASEVVASALGHIGDGLHRIADAMAARYELDLAADERSARTWDRFAELAETFAERMKREDERWEAARREPSTHGPNATEVTGG